MILYCIYFEKIKISLKSKVIFLKYKIYAILVT